MLRPSNQLLKVKCTTWRAFLPGLLSADALATGVTAGAGICAELGIPMTHRGVATSVRFLTGHARPSGEADLDEAIAAAADPHTTLIVYMGLKMLPTLTSQLLGTLAYADSRIHVCSQHESAQQ